MDDEVKRDFVLDLGGGVKIGFGLLDYGVLDARTPLQKALAYSGMTAQVAQTPLREAITNSGVAAQAVQQEGKPNSLAVSVNAHDPVFNHISVLSHGIHMLQWKGADGAYPEISMFFETREEAMKQLRAALEAVEALT